jgi:hypothetical protein
VGEKNTLLEIKTSARVMADMENNPFISDTALTDYVNKGVRQLWSFITRADQEYAITTTYLNINQTTSPNGSESEFPLPDDMQTFKGIDFLLSGGSGFTSPSNPPSSSSPNIIWVPLEKFNLQERHLHQSVPRSSTGWAYVEYGYGACNRNYTLVGDKILLAPYPNAGDWFRIRYVPLAPKLINDTDVLNSVAGSGDYVAAFAAIMMKAKEQTDTTMLASLINEFQTNFTDIIKTRDADSNNRISSVRGREYGRGGRGSYGGWGSIW